MQVSCKITFLSPSLIILSSRHWHFFHCWYVFIIITLSQDADGKVENPGMVPLDGLKTEFVYGQLFNSVLMNSCTISGTESAFRKCKLDQRSECYEGVSPQLWGACESIFLNSALFLKQQKFRPSKHSGLFEQLNILKWECLFLFWAIQSMLAVFLFQNYNCPTSSSLSCLPIILFEVNRMHEDGRFGLNVLLTRTARWRSGCLFAWKLYFQVITAQWDSHILYILSGSHSVFFSSKINMFRISVCSLNAICGNHY